MGSGINFSAIRNARGSLEAMLRELGTQPTAVAIKNALREQFTIAISDDEARLIATEAYRKDITQSYIPTPHSLVAALQRYLGVGWATQGHTASPVFAFASGPGSERVVGFRHNTELFRIMHESLAVSP
jgi:alkaline phosphatase